MTKTSEFCQNSEVLFSLAKPYKLPIKPGAGLKCACGLM